MTEVCDNSRMVGKPETIRQPLTIRSMSDSTTAKNFGLFSPMPAHVSLAYTS